MIDIERTLQYKLQSSNIAMTTRNQSHISARYTFTNINAFGKLNSRYVWHNMFFRSPQLELRYHVKTTLQYHVSALRVACHVTTSSATCCVSRGGLLSALTWTGGPRNIWHFGIIGVQWIYYLQGEDGVWYSTKVNIKINDFNLTGHLADAFSKSADSYLDLILEFLEQ